MRPSEIKNHGEVRIRRIFVILVCLNLILFNDAVAQALPAQTLQELMVPVMKAYREKDYEEALKQIDRAIQQAPDDQNMSRFRSEIILKISDQSQKEGNGIVFGPIGSSVNEIRTGDQEKPKVLEKRPKEGFHGYLSNSTEYNSNVLPSFAEGFFRPTDRPGYGNRPSIFLGYRGHIGKDYYWNVSGQGSTIFWKGKADNLDSSSFSTGLLVGTARERWDLSLAYRFSGNYFNDELTLIRQSVESNLKYWVVPKHWQTWLTTGLFFDDYKSLSVSPILAEADALQLNVSMRNYIPFYLKKLNRYGYLFGGYTFINNHVPSDLDGRNASTNFGYNGHRADLTLFIPTPFQTVGIQGVGMLEWRHYDRLNSVTRKDNIYMAYAELIKDWKLPEIWLTKKLSDTLLTKITYNYIKTQSTTALFEKVEHVARFTITYNF